MNGLPTGWTEVTLGDIAESVTNGIFVSRPGSQPNGVPILRISAVRPGRLHLDDLRYSGIDLDELSRADSLLKEGDLLFVRYNGNIDLVGACAVVPAAIGPLTYPDKLIRVRIDRRLADPHYVGYAFASPSVRAQIRLMARTTAGQVGISGSSLNKVAIPLPPLAEQGRIVDALEDHFSRLDAARQTLFTVQTRLHRLGDAVVRAATAGQLVPQDPSDKPACELLREMTSERGATTPRARRRSRGRAASVQPSEAPVEYVQEEMGI